MRKVVLTACLCTALGCAAAAFGAPQARRETGAKAVTFSVKLTPAQEVPEPKGVPKGASGTFKATLTGTTLRWTLTFSRLSGKATAAHIHEAARGKSGPVIVALCGPCSSGASGNSILSEATAATIRRGASYVNTHTAKNPGGEIRAQLTAGK